MIEREALEEMKAICNESFGRELSDAEADEAASRVIRYVTATAPPHCNGSVLSEEEGKALVFITLAIGKGKSPSVRAIATELGLSSSHSGQRMVEGLMGKGFLTRDDQGSLVIGPRHQG
jgi:hypothetical protein